MARHTVVTCLTLTCLTALTACGPAKIEHVVIVVQENHTFDAYFGRYCTAATGSNPTCTSGPACCEAAPATEPGTEYTPVVLDDTENGGYDPDHQQTCELSEIDSGKMDKYVDSTISSCGNQGNFAYANAASAQPYWSLAGGNALADNYFQPIAGQSSSNDMYFARAKYVFTDNDASPNAVNSVCNPGGPTTSYTDQTIGDLLANAGVSWSWYMEGYDDAVAAKTNTPPCPEAPAACPAASTLGSIYPCVFSPGDDPFEYYSRFTDNPAYIKDYTRLETDIKAGALPSVTFVKAYGFHSEHPGYGTTISAGTTFVNGVVSAISGSSYASSTLVLVTWDEGGGFFDHVSPPPTSTVDNQPYGTRIPLLAMGPFARKNFISHVQMEHSSIVKFLEWNWLGHTTGQLGNRDTTVNNIGSLLDPKQQQTPVPEE